ncbi:uncharacterized protein LOC113372929 [Ctenocephalides felis]|uniref:uncharacterized protein LOC113372929 n=1 Tax=Ctenocephalides felis TaxID=7515 RepID=UPI000E6E430F|nr:uncharacterized protein LOC113372929 [Ctenocephalides felis]
MDYDFQDFCSAAFSKPITINNNVINWSKTNKISVLQKDTIVILGLQLNIQQIVPKTSYERFYIRINQEYPTEQTGIDITAFFYQLEKLAVYNMVYDPILAPRLNRSKHIQPEYILASWSCPQLVTNHTCALATLTNLGFVEIYIHHLHKFYAIGSINQFWLDEIKPKWNHPATNMTGSYEAHKQRAFELHISTLVWSPYKDRYCYLVTGHTSGHIAVWKIEQIDYEHPNFAPELQFKFKHFDLCVSTLYWYKDYLFMGYTNGKVFVSGIKDEVEKPKTIWGDEDNIKIKSFKMARFDDYLALVIVKGSFFIAVLLDKELGVLHTVHTSVVPYITGIKRITDQEFVVSSVSGALTNIQLSLNPENKLQLDRQNLTIPQDPNFGTFGITCSKSRSIWAFFQSPLKVYDHLVLKQPSSIKFYSCKRFNPIDTLKNNPERRLADVWECMDYVRLKVIKQKSLLEWPCYSKTLPIYEKKILYWLSSELDNVVKRQARPVPFDITFTKKLFDQIMAEHVLKMFEGLYIKFCAGEELSVLDLRILRNYRDFFKQYTDPENIDHVGEELYVKLNESYEKSTAIQVDLPLEKCGWCEENLVDLKCPNKHLFSSCMITLLPTPEMEHLMCLVCEKIARIELMSTEPFCVFCDVKLIKQSYIEEEKMES